MNPMTFQPMATAPREPTIDSPAGPDHPRRIRMGPELALLVIVDDHAEQVTDFLVRGCWRQASDEAGCWWDYDNGEAISLTPIGWAAMPTKDEMAVLLAAASGG